jgi:hypothetical protein
VYFAPAVVISALSVASGSLIDCCSLPKINLPYFVYPLSNLSISTSISPKPFPIRAK